MTTYYGWQIILGILGFFSIVNLIVPFIQSIAKYQGDFTALIIFGIIIYLIFEKYKF